MSRLKAVNSEGRVTYHEIGGGDTDSMVHMASNLLNSRFYKVSSVVIESDLFGVETWTIDDEPVRKYLVVDADGTTGGPIDLGIDQAKKAYQMLDKNCSMLYLMEVSKKWVPFYGNS